MRHVKKRAGSYGERREGEKIRHLEVQFVSKAYPECFGVALAPNAKRLTEHPEIELLDVKIH
jgi:hypothetical protein